MTSARESDRLRTLLETGIAISSELSLDAVLERIVHAAAALTGARYVALGVIDRSGTALERFITTGIDEQTRAAIGDDFSEEDEELVTLLAAQAAVAVENARLYQSATQWSRQLESLNEIGNALVGELDLARLLHLVSTRLRELIGARLVAIALPMGSDLRIEAADGEGSAGLVGLLLPRALSKAGRVLERRRSERIDSILDDPEIHQETTRQLAATSGLFVPLLARDDAIGVIIGHDKLGSDPRFGDADLRLAEQFAARAAIAVDLSRRVQRDALRRVVAGQELERQRLARELHDETGQALTSILLGLNAVEEAPTVEKIREGVNELRELVVATLQDVRSLPVELRPKALDDFGLTAALERLTQAFSEATGIEVQLEAALGDERFPGEVETTLYRIVQEALTNTVKHAGARRVSILLMRRGGAATAVIEDDGRGFDPATAREDGLGLIGMRERVAIREGTLTVESSPETGTTLVAEVPLR